MKQSTGYKQPSYLRQSWWVIKYAIKSWTEWQDAKKWAKEYHPAWLHIITYTKNSEVKEVYRRKILETYRDIFGERLNYRYIDDDEDVDED